MVRIECILHGNLEDDLPEGHSGNQAVIEFATTPSVDDILHYLKIGRDEVQFVLADGHYIDFEHWSESTSARLMQLWPRISGG